MKRHFIWLLALYFCSSSLHAQDLRRCVRDDGSLVFTDKSCSESEVEKQVVQDLPIAQPGKKIVPLPESCSHSTDELLYNVRTAITMQDVNQLAKYYHWVDLSSTQAENILNRLELVVAKPLVDIRIIRSGQDHNDDDLADLTDLAVEFQSVLPVQQQSAVALKVIQYRANSTELESTQFMLKRHFNCWWIRY
ncbi:MAG: hypothetical protein KA902_03725 [Arenimonas sp.]|nr:hypothetical protein [Arenimonas sp.]